MLLDLVPAHPRKKKSSCVCRKKSSPDMWQRNIRKKNRMSGEEYVSTTGEVIPAKIPRTMITCGCRFQCETHIPEQKQHTLFQDYYQLQDTFRQRAFICQWVLQVPIQRRRPRAESSVEKLRSESRQYYLPGENGRSVRVWQRFFLLCFSNNLPYSRHRTRTEE